MTVENPFAGAALAAAERGWSVFPLIPGAKVPAISGWEHGATTEARHISRWWAGEARNNIGLAAGKSGLVVVDLDGSKGDIAPEEFAGARDGRDVLAMLAAASGAAVPIDTYTVATPSGWHLYFRMPPGSSFRNSVAALGWRVDTRGTGGYVVAAGSVVDLGVYRVVRPGGVADLPDWLADRLTPPPPSPIGTPMPVPPHRADAYLQAIVVGETDAVFAAQTGTRHDTLLKAARTFGRLVAGDELDEDDARAALLDAADPHIGVDGCTAAEVHRTIDDGMAYGKRLPRRLSRNRR